jgi:hypothetical protein
MQKGRMPDLSTATILAVVGWVAAQAVAYGWLDTTTSQQFLSVTSTAVALGIKAWDAYVRGKRNERAAVEAAALAALPKA